MSGKTGRPLGAWAATPRCACWCPATPVRSRVSTAGPASERPRTAVRGSSIRGPTDCCPWARFRVTALTGRTSGPHGQRSTAAHATRRARPADPGARWWCPRPARHRPKPLRGRRYRALRSYRAGPTGSCRTNRLLCSRAHLCETGAIGPTSDVACRRAPWEAGQTRGGVSGVGSVRAGGRGRPEPLPATGDEPVERQQDERTRGLPSDGRSGDGRKEEQSEANARQGAAGGGRVVRHGTDRSLWGGRPERRGPLACDQ